MPASVEFVMSSKPGSRALPPWATEHLFLVKMIEKQGLLVRTQRMGPKCRADASDIPAITLFLLAFFCDNRKGGLRGFGEHIGRWRHRLAAMAGRETLPSSSAVSRALSRMRPEDVDEIQRLLLPAGFVDSGLVAHQLAVWRDVYDQPWCVVDVDPTVVSLRQRALPEGDELPEPLRRAADVAAPGYTGRKRGQTMVSACRTQFSGSGLWCNLSVTAGNTPLDRVVVRVDGAAGNVPCMTAIKTAGLRALTRVRCYQVLKHSDVKKWLREGGWQAVLDSKSGPRREALELGIWPLQASSESRKADGAAYKPIAPRIVVSRHKPAKPGKSTALES